MDVLLSKKAKERNIINTQYVEKLITSPSNHLAGDYGDFYAWNYGIFNLLINKQL